MLRYLPGEVRVEVDDDGAGGFAPLPTEQGGGLSGMRERVHACLGEVIAGRRHPSGWRVTVRLLLDDEGAAT